MALNRVIIICVVISVFLVTASGQTIIAEDRVLPMSPEFYAALQQKMFIDRALQATDPASLTAEMANNLILNSLAAAQLPQTGMINVSSDSDRKYIALSGTSGVSSGIMEAGIYRIVIEPIDNIEITQPDKVVFLPGGTRELMISMKNIAGTGKINIENNITESILADPAILDHFESKVRKILAINPAYSLTDAAADPVLVNVRLWQDTNSNREMDKSEKPVEWANVKITFERESAAKNLSLNQGINQVWFSDPVAGINYSTDIIDLLISSGVNRLSVTKKSFLGKNESIAYENGQLTGDTFRIIPYLIYEIEVPEAVGLKMYFPEINN